MIKLSYTRGSVDLYVKTTIRFIHINMELLWDYYLDFRLEVIVMGVPRNGSESANEEDLGLWTWVVLGLAEPNWTELEINQIHQNESK